MHLLSFNFLLNTIMRKIALVVWLLIIWWVAFLFLSWKNENFLASVLSLGRPQATPLQKVKTYISKKCRLRFNYPANFTLTEQQFTPNFLDDTTPIICSITLINPKLPLIPVLDWTMQVPKFEIRVRANNCINTIYQNPDPVFCSDLAQQQYMWPDWIQILNTMVWQWFAYLKALSTVTLLPTYGEFGPWPTPAEWQPDTRPVTWVDRCESNILSTAFNKTFIKSQHCSAFYLPDGNNDNRLTFLEKNNYVAQTDYYIDGYNDFVENIFLPSLQ